MKSLKGILLFLFFYSLIGLFVHFGFMFEIPLIFILIFTTFLNFKMLNYLEYYDTKLSIYNPFGWIK